MEKASRVLRRSGVKLLSLGGANTDLSVTLSEVKNMRTSAKAFMNAQNLASHDMMRWAAHEQNTAIQDTFNQMSELNLLWTEVQNEFIDNLKEFRQMFEMILSGEKQIFLAKQNSAVCEQKEAKYRKELGRIVKKGALESEMRMLESRIQQAERAKELAYAELGDRARENECIKLTRLKSGLLKISEAYIEMSTKCSLLFTAQRDVVLQLPDVNEHNLDAIKYSGRTTTTYVVEQARNQIKKYRRNSQTGTSSNEPPPPYTPTPPDSSPTLPIQQLIVPVRNPTPPGRHPTRSTLPSYQQIDSNQSPTADCKSLERHSEASLPYCRNTVSMYVTLPPSGSRKVSQLSQDCDRGKSETIPRTRSEGRIIPRNPAPPIPKPRSSVCSTDSSVASSSENLTENLAGNGNASQSVVFNSASLHSSQQSTDQVLMGLSDHPSPSAQGQTENSTKSHAEKRTPFDSNSQTLEEIDTAVSVASPDNEDNDNSVKQDICNDTSDYRKRSDDSDGEHNTVDNVESSNIFENLLDTNSFIGTVEKESKTIMKPLHCLQETDDGKYQENSASQHAGNFENIPFIDSTSVDESPTLSSEDCFRKGSLINNDTGTKVGNQDVHNTNTEQGTKLDAFETGDLLFHKKHGIEVMGEEIHQGNKILDNAIIQDELGRSVDSSKVTGGLLDEGDGDEEYDTAEDEENTIGAVGGAS